MLTNSIYSLFYYDTLAILLTLLVVFIGSIATHFSTRYMQGDSQYTTFIRRMLVLMVSVVLMVGANHWLVLLAAWALSNALLIRLMVHQTTWRAARHSGWLTAKSFAIGFVCLSGALLILNMQTGQVSVQAMLQQFNPADNLQLLALILITVAAMTQSAIWPFHRWLLSSLNSPTPVSALMHAGLVNGGGFLLARFAPLYLAMPSFLNILLLVGVISAVMGTFWKLIQPDVKRMLACSTMGQMGFMFIQCGLGLFPAAIAHLCWHGMFKANLFLASNSVVQEKRVTAALEMKWPSLIAAILCGLAGSTLFAAGLQTTWFVHDSRFVLIMMSAITASQFALSMLSRMQVKSFLIALAMTAVLSYAYGFSIFMFESLFSGSNYQAQPLTIFHIILILLLTLAWFVVLFRQQLVSMLRDTSLLHRMYMQALNASQPARKTITSYRNEYQYN